jgi:hypothetical protein
MNEAVALVDGVPDGLLLHEWAEQHDVGKTTSYAFVKILKAMGIEVKMMKRKGVARATAFLEGTSMDAINHLLMQHRQGKSLAQLEADHTSALVPAQTATPAAMEDESTFDPSGLLDRMQAAELAINTGMPLSKKEMAWIIGVSDVSRIPANTRIRIGRTSLQKWTLLAPTAENLINMPAG